MLPEWMTALWLRIKALVYRRRLERDLDDELQFHVAMREQKLVEQGMPSEEARYAARRAFGNQTRTKESNRELWTFPFLETLWQDLSYGLRQLRRNPGFTAVAVITLALGIGANTAMFSVVNAVLIRPLPYAHSDRLVAVSNYLPKMQASVVLNPDFGVWRNDNKVFEQLAAYGGGASYNLTGAGHPQRVEGLAITANLLPLLGLNPILGRNFLTEEDQPGGQRVVILSHRLWDRLGDSPSILGKRLTLDGVAYSVVGVLPASFRFPAPTQPDLLRPLALSLRPEWDVRKPMTLLRVIGRLKPHVTVEQALANVGVMDRWIQRQLPPPMARMTEEIRAEVVPLQLQLAGRARRFLPILLASAGFVLLIACTNLASLQMERMTARRKEIGLRVALGASRARVVRASLTESGLIASCGGGLALAIGFGGIGILRALAPQEITSLYAVTLDARVVLFTFLLAALAVVLFGVAPAIAAVKVDPNQALKDSAPHEFWSRFRIRKMLVATEIASAVVLVVGAGLLIRSFISLVDVDSGFNPSHLLTVQTWLPLPQYGKAPQQLAFFREVLSRVKQLPVVVDAAAAYNIPFAGFGGRDRIAIEGVAERPSGAEPTVPTTSVSEDYFKTLGVPLVAGRFFTLHDAKGSPPVVVVNQAFVNRFSPGRNPIGRRVQFNGNAWREIIGVAGDVRQLGLDRPSEPELFVPFLQRPVPFGYFIVRTASDPLILATGVRAAVESVDKDQPIFDVQTMEQRIATSIGSRRFNMFLLTAFALLALTLAAVGLYGVVSYSLSLRTHEIGIRMALGAEKRDVLGMVVGKGLKLALIGVAIGIAGALALTRFLSSLLYGVKPTDPLTFIAVSVILVAVALLACYIPARRAAKVDPMVALRYE
jgi:putative ABC transport system permease protein